MLRILMVLLLSLGFTSHGLAGAESVGKGAQSVPAPIVFEDGFERVFPPNLDALGSVTISLGADLDIQVSASDPDSDSLLYTLPTAPNEMTISYASGRIYWRPSAADLGEHPVIVKVQDSNGLSASTSFDVIVLNFPGDLSPTLEPISDQSTTVDAQLMVQAEAFDPNVGDLLSFSLTKGPSGMSIDAGIGLLSWQPSVGQTGSFPVEVTVTDRTGLSDAAPFVVTVVTDAPTAVDDGYVARIGETLTVGAPGLLGNDIDPNGDTLSAVLVSEPSSGELVLNSDGSFNYTPVAPPATGELNPGLEVFFNTFDASPESTKSAVTPAVADVNLDGDPDIVFSTYTSSTRGLLRAITVRESFATDTNLAAEYPRPNLNVSSFFASSPTWPPERAIDGDLETSWFTADDDPDIFFELQFANEITIRELQMFGTREFPTGHDFISGIFRIFDSNDNLLYDSGEVAFPAPDRDITLDVGEIESSRRVLFLPTDFEGMGSPGFDPAFSELRVIGDGPIMEVEELWAAETERLFDSSGIAVGDIDQDGYPEIIAIEQSGGPIAFEHDGTRKWLAESLGSYNWATPSLADLDQDGTPEIIVGNVVLNNDGTVRWRGSENGGSGTGNNGVGPISTTADLNLDGVLEVVAGSSAHFADGSLYWNSSVGDGFPGIGNFDGDPYPEVVIVDSGSVSLLEHDGSVKWGPVEIPEGGRGGAPTVADVDADGEPEIGVAGGSRYVMFETDGSVKWTQEIEDLSSNVTGSSVFDFQNDGETEVVYRDEENLYIYAGTTGEILYMTGIGSTTGYENPIVVDVDNDQQAEIVTVADVGVTRRAFPGIYVFGGFDKNWIPTRKIWNQHAYHVTNVNPDSTIPAQERPNWLATGLNNFRQNAFPLDEVDDEFSYIANDGSLDSNVAIVSLDSRPLNNAPDFTSVALTVAAPGFAYEYVATATDPDPFDPVSFGLAESPAGMTVAASSGLTAWMPTQSDLGDHLVSIRASDAAGFTNYQTFTLSVIPPATVPNLVGKPVAQADVGLAASGLSKGAEIAVGSATLAVGRVAQQDPAAGASASPGSSVDLFVSAGLPVIVPDVVGLTRSGAESALENTDLLVGLVDTMHSATVVGRVLVQAPGSGAEAPPGGTVDLTLSSGPAPQVVPDVVGSKLELATVRLEDVGFAVGSVARVRSITAPSGDVLSQDPIAGASEQGGALIDLTVSAGNAVSVLAASDLVYAGDSLSIDVTAYDSNGSVISPTPDYTLSLEFMVDEVSGTNPSFSGDLLNTSSNTRGAYVVRATLTSGGDSDTLNVTVLPPVAAGGSRAMLNGMADDFRAIEEEIGQLIPAISNGQTGSITQINNRLQAIGDGIELEPLRVTTPFAPENGFLPTLTQLTNAGFPQTGDDGRYNARLRELVAVLRSVEALLVNQDPASAYDDNVFEEQLNRNLSAIQDELASLSPSVYGVVAAKDHFHQIVSVRLPTIMLAELNRVDAVLRADGLLNGQSKRVGASSRKFFNLIGIMTAAKIRTKIIDDFYRPILRDMARAAVVLAARGLLQEYANLGELDAVITGASLSFHLFGLPGTTIEGSGMNTVYAPANDVFLIGPDAIGAVETILGTISADGIEDLDDLKDKFDEVKEAAVAFNGAFNQSNSSPDTVATGCLFSFDSNCAELIYSSGFASVYSTGGFNFPAPVLIIARNLTTGQWGAIVANFFPADSE